MNADPMIFVINPGSTSTKIALFRGTETVFEDELRHPREEIEQFDTITDQTDYRKDVALKCLADNNINLEDIDIFVGRGGLLRPIPGGVFSVNELMLPDLASCKFGHHASNLGAPIAQSLAQTQGKNALIADPVVVDELCDVARISGHPDLPRLSIFHALNQKAVAKKAAAELGKAYNEVNLIVMHAGGGISIGAHEKGKVVDVNNALQGEGPFTPERTGGLTALQFYRYAVANDITVDQAGKMITRNGGLLAHIGTNDCKHIEEEIVDGNEKFALVYNAMIYNIGKYIGSLAAGLKGKVDAIVLTGGMVRGDIFTNGIKEMVDFIAPVMTFVKNSEMEALAMAALEVHHGKDQPKTY